MTINQILFINEYGQIRLSRTYNDKKVQLSKDLIRKCLKGLEVCIYYNSKQSIFSLLTISL